MYSLKALFCSEPPLVSGRCATKIIKSSESVLRINKGFTRSKTSRFVRKKRMNLNFSLAKRPETKDGSVLWKQKLMFLNPL